MGLRNTSPSALAHKLNGTPVLLGTITVAGASKNNADTAVPFSNTGNCLKGKTLLLQPSASVHVLPGTASNSTVTTSNGVKIGADERVIITMAEDYGWLAVIGTADVKVWELI